MRSGNFVTGKPAGGLYTGVFVKYQTEIRHGCRFAFCDMHLQTMFRAFGNQNVPMPSARPFREISRRPSADVTVIEIRRRRKSCTTGRDSSASSLRARPVVVGRTMDVVDRPCDCRDAVQGSDVTVLLNKVLE